MQPGEEDAEAFVRAAGRAFFVPADDRPVVMRSAGISSGDGQVQGSSVEVGVRAERWEPRRTSVRVTTSWVDDDEADSVVKMHGRARCELGTWLRVRRVGSAGRVAALRREGDAVLADLEFLDRPDMEAWAACTLEIDGGPVQGRRRAGPVVEAFYAVVRRGVLVMVTRPVSDAPPPTLRSRTDWDALRPMSG